MRGGLSPALLIVVAALLAGCGGERELSAEDFVEEMNGNGAALALGGRLTDAPDGSIVYTVTLTDAAPSAAGGEGGAPTDLHGSATLLIATDADAAEGEFGRCEQAPDLTCFRAANAVLRAEGLQGADQARIATAIEAMAN